MGKTKLKQFLLSLFQLFTMMSLACGQPDFEQEDLYLQWQPDWPTCAELRTMWLTLRSMTQDSILTNEIPVLSNDFFRKPQGKQHSRHHLEQPLRSEGTSKQSYRDLLKNAMASPAGNSDGFSWDSQLDSTPSFPRLDHQKPETFHSQFKDSRIAQPGSHQTISDDGAIGPFGDLSDNFAPDLEFGVFGQFPVDEEAKTRQKSNVRTVKVNSGDWHGQPATIGLRMVNPGTGRLLQETCERIENRPCSSHDQCACIGHMVTSKCTSGRCHITLTSKTGNLMDFGTWHDKPIPSSQLGMTLVKKGAKLLRKRSQI